jgi:HTH-type transcriptional regulator / antitoxin HigA
MDIKPTLTPAEVFPAGEFLREELDERGWSDSEFAQILGRPPQVISEIINGKKEITTETAVAIADALGTSPEYWLNLQTAFRLREVRAKLPKNNSVIRMARLRDKVPLRELRKRGWVTDTEDLDVLEAEISALLRPLEAADFAAAARKTDSDSPFTPEQRAWLARVLQVAKARNVSPFDIEALRVLGSQLRTIRPDELTSLQQRFGACGVALVIEPQLPGSKLDGAAMRPATETAVIGLTTRGDRFDIFLWTLLHEVAHLLLGHVDVQSVRIDEELGYTERVGQELEADTLAEQLLFPKGFRAPRPPYSMGSLVAAGLEQGVHFSSVLGRLQHDGLVSPAHLRKSIPRVRSFLEVTQ